MNPPLNRADLIALCGRLPDSYEDYPFDDPNWTVMRHRTNRRSYALIFERQGRLWVNVKAEPAWGDFWKQTYPAVVPAYHMNKRHWIGIVLDGSMTAEPASMSAADLKSREACIFLWKKLPERLCQCLRYAMI